MEGFIENNCQNFLFRCFSGVSWAHRCMKNSIIALNRKTMHPVLHRMHGFLQGQKKDVMP
jgi:hypothetical protein